MYNTRCPHCGKIENNRSSLIVCVRCGKTMVTKEQREQRCDDRINTLHQNEQYDRILTEIQIDGYKTACKSVMAIFKCDPVQACDVLDKIKQLEGITSTPKVISDDQRCNTATSVHVPVRDGGSVQLTTCPVCDGKISTRATACPHCGNPTGVHTCPKCGSTNTKTISGASKAASIYLWGPFAANKVVSKFQCKDCWHKW